MSLLEIRQVKAALALALIGGAGVGCYAVAGIAGPFLVLGGMALLAVLFTILIWGLW